VVAEQAGRQQRLAAVELDQRERSQGQQARSRAYQDGGGAPAEARAADEREHEQGEAERDAERAGQVEPTARVAPAVGGDQREREQQREAGEGDVDEEDRFPTERLREEAAEQHAEDEAGCPGTAPDCHGPVALAPFGEGRID
jgi:hypothetical protein